MTLSVAVLVSEGRHPASGRVRRADCDARALELAMGVPDAALTVLHAGDAKSPALRSYLGMGAARLDVLAMPHTADPTTALTGYLADQKPDLVLAGRRAEYGEGSGFLPYRIARDLAWPLVSDACAITVEGDRVTIIQALPKGRRRRLRVPLPALVTVGPAAPPARQSAFAKARRGQIVATPVSAEPATDPWLAGPARPRAKRLQPIDPNASAEERLRAVTELKSTDGEVVTGLTPEAAAERLLAHLVASGAIAEPGRTK